MHGYLLDEKNFIALKSYINFLSSLPVTLTEIQRFSESFQRQGHRMITPPNAVMLAQAARTNDLAWQSLKVAVPSLGQSCAKALADAQGFIDEFRDTTKLISGRALVSSIDPARFSIFKSLPWSVVAAVDVISLLRELDRRLSQCAAGIAQFKQAVNTVGGTLHSIFVRFIESLSIDLCSCDGPISKIEAYYTLGRIGLPGMQYNPGGSYSHEQRVEYARAHLSNLRSMRSNTACAVDNLNDFCYRLVQLIEHARRQLQANHPRSSVDRCHGLFSIAEVGLSEVRDMSEDLILISGKLNP